MNCKCTNTFGIQQQQNNNIKKTTKQHYSKNDFKG